MPVRPYIDYNAPCFFSPFAPAVIALFAFLLIRAFVRQHRLIKSRPPGANQDATARQSHHGPSLPAHTQVPWAYQQLVHEPDEP